MSDISIPYSPLLAGKIPAFIEKNDKYFFQIPFQDNVAFNRAKDDKICLKLRSISDTVIYCTDKDSVNIVNNIAYFELDKMDSLYVGQYYKIQIAYKKGTTIGVYSQTGIIKYAAPGQVEILNLQLSQISSKQYIFQGKYTIDQTDPYETEQKYSFNIYTNKQELFETSGLLIHQPSQEIDEWMPTKEIPEGQIYYITYEVRTLNGLIQTSPPYPISNDILFENIYENLKVQVQCDSEEGRNIISLKEEPENNNFSLITGEFVLSRKNEQTKEIVILNNFYLKFENLKNQKIIYYDYLIEQGHKYTYFIQQKNQQKIYSEKIIGNTVVADFEHMYLLDKNNRQLKIKFNPKISNLKNTVLESKVDTLGGKYPYIFRNNVVDYKEMNLSGLISYLSDENNIFQKKYNEFNTDLTLDNIYQERQFKLEVLNWLTNGEIKLLKTPTEGNYFVRLLNVSMTPVDTVGRMLHTFSATAYETLEYNIYNLRQLEFLPLNILINIPEQYEEIWQSFELSKLTDNQKQFLENLEGQSVNKIQITGANPGTSFELAIGNNNSTSIVIGATGHYEIQLDETEIKSIKFLEENLLSGIITFNSKKLIVSPIDNIYSISNTYIPATTIYGQFYDSETKEFRMRELLEKNSFGKNASIINWTFISFRERPIIDNSNEPINNNIFPIEDNSLKFTILPDYNLYLYDNKIYEKLYCLNKDDNQDSFTTYYQEIKDNIEEENLIIFDDNSDNAFSLQPNQIYTIDNPDKLNVKNIKIGWRIVADVGFYFKNYFIGENMKNYQDYQDVLLEYKGTDNILGRLKAQYLLEKINEEVN